jgi:hypothetical protein
MPKNPQAGLAETIERHRVTFVLFIFLIGLGQGSRVLEYHYPGSDYAWMHVIRYVLLLVQVLLLVLLLIQTVRIFGRGTGCSRQRCRSMLMESYVERTSFIALAVSWFFTFVMAQLLGEWTESDVIFYGPHDPASLFPATYYLELLTCLLTLSYSIVFFALYLRSNAGAEAIDA